MTRSADEVAKSKDDEAPNEAVEEVDDRCLREVSDPAESFHGIDIAAIAEHFPGSGSALCRLRSDLVTQAEKPLLPWELTRLGARAAIRAVRLANRSSLQGLLSLGEVAQDYPSGWGRALSAGTSEDTQTARELMEEAEALRGDDALEVNGWQIPEKQRGLLPLLRAQLPLFRSAELLAFSGISQSWAFALLRDARSGPALPSKVNTGDPRLGDVKAHTGRFKQGQASQHHASKVE
ncbi:ggtA [Symbiodinium pilosum]|uniref:GgtA protein n=1 Tax=Symbiodinium pilosum TaxID=2952 RepID=A0A812UNQ4_SYMPI|nr:ggtA [Symbiodinium pilosum]